MRLSNSNIVLLVLVLLLFGFQVFYATTSACPADTISKMHCWGPRGVDFLGLTLNIGYVYVQLILVMIALGISSVTTFVVYNLLFPLVYSRVVYINTDIDWKKQGQKSDRGEAEHATSLLTGGVGFL